MWVGKVIGNMVATQKDSSLIGSKLLFVQPLRLGCATPASPVVAVDLIGAGAGETVLVVAGSSARQVTGKPQGAVDAAIVGIVDSMEISEDLFER